MAGLSLDQMERVVCMEASEKVVPHCVQAANPSLMTCLSRDMKKEQECRLAASFPIYPVQAKNAVLSSTARLCKFKKLSENRLSTPWGGYNSTSEVAELPKGTQK